MAPQKYHHGNLKTALLQAGSSILHEKGPSQLSLRAAARGAGVSPAAPYRHFASRAALLAAIAELGFQQLEKEMIAAYNRTQVHALEALQSLAHAYVDFARNQPHQFNLMFGPEVSGRSAYPALQEAAERTFARVEEAILRGQEEGSILAGDPEVIALTLWSALHGLASLILAEQLNRKSLGQQPFDANMAVNLVTMGLYQGFRAS